MIEIPAILATASAPRLPSLRVNASGLTLDLNQNTRYTIPPSTGLIFDLQLAQLCMLNIDKGQAPQRVIGDSQWALPDNPAPNVTDNRGAPLFKPGMLLPVGVCNGSLVQPAELMASTIGARSSIEALFAQVATEMNTAGAAGLDVAVALTFAGTQIVPMGGGNSYRLIFENVQVIDTPKEMIEFRSQFNAMVEHAKRTPIKLPAPTSFAAPPAFGAPSGVAPGWAPPVSQPPTFGVAPAAPTFPSAPTHPTPIAQPVAPMPFAAAPNWQTPVVQHPSATPPWLQAPQAPMAPMAPAAPDDDGM
jgi:hypothetical protein